MYSEAKQNQRAFSLLGMKIILDSNRRELLADDEYFLGKGGHLHSLLSNFHTMEEISVPNTADVVFHVVDNDGGKIIYLENGKGEYTIGGPLLENERTAKDKRLGIFGNMGFFSKLLVRELEQKGIFSLHSTSFFDRSTNRLFLVVGSSGSGKSTVLLNAIDKGGIEVFGTELTHFSFVSGNLVLLKGSLWQNCRMGNLVVDFPRLMDYFGLSKPEGDLWHSYQSIPLHHIQVAEDSLQKISIVILFPRIEGERHTSSIQQVSRGSIKFSLFQNLSEKISSPSLLWGKYFIPSIDLPEHQIARMASAERFLDEGPIESCWSILSSPARSLDGLYPGAYEK